MRDFDVNSQKYRSRSTSGRNASYGMAQDTFPAAASDGFPNFDILKAVAHNEEADLDSYRTTSSKTSSRHQVSAAVSHLAWGLLLGFKAVGPLLETSSTEQNKARRPFN